MGTPEKIAHYRMMIMDFRSMLLALVIGLIFALINAAVTISSLGVWTDLIFQNACNISLLYDDGFGKVPYIHLFISGMPLFVLAGVVTAIVTSKSIKNTTDAVIIGSTAGIVSSVVPYGSSWALFLLFADYWADLPMYMSYFLLVILGVIIFIPLTALGACYYFEDQQKYRSGKLAGTKSRIRVSISRVMHAVKMPLILVVVTVLTLVVPIAIAYVYVQAGLILGSPL